MEFDCLDEKTFTLWQRRLSEFGDERNGSTNEEINGYPRSRPYC